METRDRIKELRRVRAKDLLANPKNWRVHPAVQTRALRTLLSDIGYADALIARELPDGRLELIDGHLRAETTPDAMVPVLVLDVSEAEAYKLLATLDPLAALAESDAARLKALLETVRSDDEAVRELLRRTAGERLWESLYPHELDEAEVSPEKADELKAKWRTVPGQSWQCGPHKLICGDSTDQTVVARLFRDASLRVRMLFADIPYGVHYEEKAKWTNRHRRGAKRPPN
jgi:hypothetical protein